MKLTVHHLETFVAFIQSKIVETNFCFWKEDIQDFISEILRTLSMLREKLLILPPSDHQKFTNCQNLLMFIKVVCINSSLIIFIETLLA